MSEVNGTEVYKGNSSPNIKLREQTGNASGPWFKLIAQETFHWHKEENIQLGTCNFCKQIWPPGLQFKGFKSLVEAIQLDGPKKSSHTKQPIMKNI